MDFNMTSTFDTNNALAGMYLWLIFGLLSTMVNCDIQRFILYNPIGLHIFAIIAFLFLFTLIDQNNKTSVFIIVIKTFLIYVLFLLITKSKWYFILPILILLLIDQLLKKQLAIEKEKQKDTETLEMFQQAYTNVIIYLIMGMAVIGALHYAYLQKQEYQNEFSWFKFFFTVTKCKEISST